MKTANTEGRLPLADPATAIEELISGPAKSLETLRHLLGVFELDARLLPSFRAALRAMEQAEGHLRACQALAEQIEQGVL